MPYYVAIDKDESSALSKCLFLTSIDGSLSLCLFSVLQRFFGSWVVQSGWVFHSAEPETGRFMKARLNHRAGHFSGLTRKP
ncbi:hypothetical protein CEXT_228261 [Caerostris extrusa]|uniref:Uncharacterized protein n=1 Tax=Caerostris extrusa TaxID=172846 RepID=A0AAV4XF49_CAEEX|nr:hypothetical protein CEXT_228261 [Caerostris extrusa]